MTIQKISGRDALLLLKDIFNIKQESIRKIVITAEINDVCIIDVESFAKINKNEISVKDLENSKYEVTIKKIEV